MVAWATRQRNGLQQKTNGFGRLTVWYIADRPVTIGAVKLTASDDTVRGFRVRTSWEAIQARAMQLRLRVVSYKGLPDTDGLVCTFDSCGGSIGRSPDNLCLLPDPEKFVSRKHACIHLDRDSFLLTDTSSAGTFLLDRNLTLQHDSVALADGERIRIGDYELVAEMVSTVDTDLTETEGYASHLDWLLGTAGEYGPGPNGSEAREPLFADVAEPALSSALPGLTVTERDTPSFVGRADAGPEHEFFPPPQVQTSPPPELPELRTEDLFSDLDAGAGIHPTSPADDHAPEAAMWELPDELFTAEPGQLNLQGSLVGSVTIVPEPSPTAAEGREALTAVDASPLPTGSAPVAASLALDDPAVEASVAPSCAEQPPVQAELSEDSYQAGALPQRPTRAEPSEGGAPVIPPVDLANRPFEIFLEGAGIPTGAFPPDEQLAERMRTLGLVFRELLDGVMALLRARAESQIETGVSRTVVRASHNNPLKFVPSVDDAIRILTDRQHSGFLDPLSAVREAVRDLIGHQMAMQAGIRDSLSEALARFDPERFERRFQEGIVFQKRAKCWDCYRKVYPELVEQAIQELFGEKFRSGYLKLIDQIHSQRHDPE